MFRSKLNTFYKKECPGLRHNGKCNLINCIFSHRFQNFCDKTSESAKGKTIQQPIKSPAIKKRKVQASLINEKDAKYTKDKSPKKSESDRKVLVQPRKLPMAKNNSESKPTLSNSNKPVENQKSLESSTIKIDENTKNEPDIVSLVPVPITPFPPAPHTQRLAFVRLIYQELQKSKVDRPKAKAVKYEQEIAKKSSKATYNNQIKLFIVKLKRGEILHELREQEAASINEKENEKSLLDSKLKDLIISKKILESNDFIVEPVKSTSLPKEYDVSCLRCKTMFASQRIMASGPCVYHWAFPPYDSTYTIISKKKKKSRFDSY